MVLVSTIHDRRSLVGRRVLHPLSANSLLQATVSPALRGRAVSLYMLALQGGISIGSPLTGIPVNFLRVRDALRVNGTLAVMAHLAIGRQWMRSTVPIIAV
jgi:hypothetical protein